MFTPTPIHCPRTPIWLLPRTLFFLHIRPHLPPNVSPSFSLYKVVALILILVFAHYRPSSKNSHLLRHNDVIERRKWRHRSTPLSFFTFYYFQCIFFYDVIVIISFVMFVAIVGKSPGGKWRVEPPKELILEHLWKPKNQFSIIAKTCENGNLGVSQRD